MIIGYARISTRIQNLTLQKAALEEAGCEKIYGERASGRKICRPSLAKALEQLRPGDTLVVWKLDRLSRNLKHLISMVEDFTARGIKFCTLLEKIDTSTPMGRFYLNVIGSHAEAEWENIVERTKAGLKVARDMGRVGGRPRLMPDSKLESARYLLSLGMSARKVADNLGVSVPTLYRHLPASTWKVTK